jgi:serine/threonine protein kinase
MSVHPNIVQCHSLYLHDDHLYIIQDLLDCSLSSLLSPSSRFPLPLALYTFREVLKAVCFLHSRSRLHRDLKSDNIFLSSSGIIKLGDLGSSAQLTSSRPFRTTLAGSLLWLSPEILREEPYSTPADIWALGIILAELLDGTAPYASLGRSAVISTVLSSGVKLTSTVPCSVQRLFTSCTALDPSKRPSAASLLLSTDFSEMGGQASLAEFLRPSLLLIKP